VFGFAHLSTAANISTESAIIRSDNDGPHPTLPQLSTNLVKERVQSGRVYVHDDFLTESQLNLLQRGSYCKSLLGGTVTVFTHAKFPHADYPINYYRHAAIRRREQIHRQWFV